jgi:hypothetical protein
MDAYDWKQPARQHLPDDHDRKEKIARAKKQMITGCNAAKNFIFKLN